MEGGGTITSACLRLSRICARRFRTNSVAISRPCLVKFRTTGRALELATALLYLCHSVHEMELVPDLGLTHDAGGCRIAGERIVHVNWDVP